MIKKHENDDKSIFMKYIKDIKTYIFGKSN